MKPFFAPRTYLRPIPPPESVPEPVNQRSCSTDSAFHHVAVRACVRAEKIILRVYGPHRSGGNGFHNPEGFVSGARALGSRNRIYKWLVHELLARDEARGKHKGISVAKPQRIMSRRTKGFCLQESSRAINGLPAKRVTRPSRWGNPWRIEDYLDAGYDVTRLAAARVVVAAHRAWLAGERHWAHGSTVPPVPDLSELRGHNLACTCPPGQPCHADTLIEFANR